MEPNGSVADAGWALARLNDAAAVESQSFSFPDTTNAVRLFLIDTAVANPGAWFDGNANVTFEHSELVRGVNDPATSSAFKHGTRMLSLIAGPGTGGAPGTPVSVVSYDVYPQGEGSNTTSALVASALTRARSYHIDNPGLPGIILIASSSSSPDDSALLRNRILAARQVGLTVIVSAGNSGADASGFVPAAFGTEAGVICVGASNQANSRLAMSNFGPAVDLYAPGENVRTIRYDQPAPGAYDLMTGTSPAAALTAAAAVIALSKNPQFTPAEVEAAIKDSVYPSVVDIVQIPPDPDLDSDADGTSDHFENFFGTDPLLASSRPAPLRLGGNTIQSSLNFTISKSLFNPSQPLNLLNGAAWKLVASMDLKDWSDVEGAVVTHGPASGSKVPVTVSFPSGDPRCYVRIALTLP